MPLWQTIFIFGVSAVIFDAIWATIARYGGYSYAKGMWVSWLIYAVAGGVAARYTDSILDGAWSGLSVACVEATVGWWVSAVIGPGRLPKTTIPRTIAIAIAVSVAVLTGSLFGTAGAIAANLFI